MSSVLSGFKRQRPNAEPVKVLAISDRGGGERGIDDVRGAGKVRQIKGCGLGHGSWARITVIGSAAENVPGLGRVSWLNMAGGGGNAGVGSAARMASATVYNGPQICFGEAVRRAADYAVAAGRTGGGWAPPGTPQPAGRLLDPGFSRAGRIQQAR